MGRNFRTYVLVSDVHSPHEDKQAYGIALDIIFTLKPDELILLGDFNDFYNLNSYGKSPKMARELFDDEIDESNTKLNEFNTRLPNTKKIYIEGNHENRLERYVSENCPDIASYTPSIQEILQLDGHNFHYIPYSNDQIYLLGNTGIVAKHEPSSGGLHVAHNTLSKGHMSCIFGHTHRSQVFTHIGLDGKEFIAINAGWLGDPKSTVFKYMKNIPQWKHTIVQVTEFDDGTWFYDVIQIKNGIGIANGNIFEKSIDLSIKAD